MSILNNILFRLIDFILLFITSNRNSILFVYFKILGALPWGGIENSGSDGWLLQFLKGGYEG